MVVISLFAVAAAEEPQIVSEKAALKVHGGSANVNGDDGRSAYWRSSLNEMHDNNAATKDPQIVSEKAALKVYGGSANGFWRSALDEMHDNNATSATKDPQIAPENVQEIRNPQADLHATAEGMVRYMEYFANTVAMDLALGDLAKRNNASILRTNPTVFGKSIRTYSSKSYCRATQS
jgi:hypothetical protein